MSSVKKNIIKVTFEGETKRLKHTNSYELLLKQIREKFHGTALDKLPTIKFYYLDDEQELISITSQSDLQEALEIEDVTTLKLIVATSANEARQQLENQICDNMSMSSSIKQVQPMGTIPSARQSPLIPELVFEPVKGVEERRPETERNPQPEKLLEANNLVDTMKNLFQNAISEVSSLVTKAETLAAQTT